MKFLINKDNLFISSSEFSSVTVTQKICVRRSHVENVGTKSHISTVPNCTPSNSTSFPIPWREPGLFLIKYQRICISIIRVFCSSGATPPWACITSGRKKDADWTKSRDDPVTSIFSTPILCFRSPVNDGYSTFVTRGIGDTGVSTKNNLDRRVCPLQSWM